MNSEFGHQVQGCFVLCWLIHINVLYDLLRNIKYFIPGDKNTFNFSKLPEIIGTGEKYTVKVEYLVVPMGSDQEVSSKPLQGIFTTKPLAPSNFKVAPESNEISWTRSGTPRVRSYKVRWNGEK